jgi:hypothetical protein
MIFIHVLVYMYINIHIPCIYTYIDIFTDICRYMHVAELYYY